MYKFIFVKLIILIIQILYLSGFIVTITQKLYQEETDFGITNFLIIFVCHSIFNIQFLRYLQNQNRPDTFYLIWVILFSLMIMEAFSLSIIVICNPKYRGDSGYFSIPKLLIYLNYVYVVIGITFIGICLTKDKTPKDFLSNNTSDINIIESIYFDIA